MDELLLEVAVEESLESCAMTGFVLCHLMYGVVDGIQVQSLCLLGNLHLTCASTFFCQHALLHVGLGIPKHFAQQFSNLGCMLCILKRITLESL